MSNVPMRWCAAAILLIGAQAVLAQQTVIGCKNPAWGEAAIVTFYVLDSAARTVERRGSSSKPEIHQATIWTDTEIVYEQQRGEVAATASSPALRVIETTRLDRMTGERTTQSHYVDASGRRLSNAEAREVEQRAGGLGLFSVGVVGRATCAPAQRQF